MGPRRGRLLLGMLAGLAAASIFLPIVALLWGANWQSFGSDIAAPEARSALQLSFATALVTTLVCLLLGVPLALYLARSSSGLAFGIRLLVNLPLVMPPLVGGLALLMLFGRRGLLGGPLYDLFGFQLGFTTPAVVVAQIFVALPFMVITVEGVARTISPEHEMVAASLGATPAAVFWHVTVPLLKPGLVAGAVLSFSRALGEFGATALFAGNRPGVTQTMPLAIYTAFNGGGVSASAATALAILLMGASIMVMLLTGSWDRRGAK